MSSRKRPGTAKVTTALEVRQGLRRGGRALPRPTVERRAGASSDFPARGTRAKASGRTRVETNIRGSKTQHGARARARPAGHMGTQWVTQEPGPCPRLTQRVTWALGPAPGDTLEWATTHRF